jgi:DNA-binding MarR family transcriptional regulator
VPRGDAALQLDNQLCFAAYRVSHAFTAAYKPLLEPLGLTYPQYLAMLVLWEGDGVTVSELGARLGLDSGTLTPLLKRLDSAGLVQRLRDVQDERRVRIGLTPAGRALKQKAKAIPQKLLCASGLSRPEIGRLHGRLDRLAANLLGQPADGGTGLSD